MRRLIAVLLAGAALVAAGPGAMSPAAAGTGGAVVEVRDAWIVGKGAAAQTRLRVTCTGNDGISPTVLWVQLKRVDDDAEVARGEVVDVDCAGQAQRIVVPLSPTGTTRVTPGAWKVDYRITNCLETDICYDVSGSHSPVLEAKPFVTPFDDDVRAELTLVKVRRMDTGDVRVVYDLSCSTENFWFETVTTRLTQVGKNGAVRSGSGWFWNDAVENGEFRCRPEPRRLRFAVEADGPAFRPGTMYVDSDFGEWYEFGHQATDRRVVTLG